MVVLLGARLVTFTCGCSSHADLLVGRVGLVTIRSLGSPSPHPLPPDSLPYFRRLVFPSAVSEHFATAGEQSDSKQWHGIGLLRCGHVSIPTVRL